MFPRWLGDRSGDPQIAVRLLCFPFSGGGASFYRPWIAALAPTIEVIPVQLPGREERFTSPAFDRMAPLVAALVAEVVPRLRDCPFAVFGHSMGALVAYEFARACALERGLHAVHAFVSGQLAPHLRALRGPMYDLPQGAFVDRLRSLGGTPDAMLASAELMEAFTPLLRADLAVGDTYEAPFDNERLTCPVTAFFGRDDVLTTPAGVRDWQAVTAQPFAAHEFPGGHFFLNDHRDALLHVIRTSLMRAGTDGTASS